MARSVLLLVIGAMVGGAAVYLFAKPEPARESVESVDAAVPASVAPDSLATANPDIVADGGSRFAAERLAVYQQAATTTDSFDLETMIERASAEPVSRLRDMKLTALLARFAELDPRRAVAFAQSRYLETRFLLPLFEALARTDSAAALAELALISPAPKQRKIALAILNVIGNDSRGFEQVVAALPDQDRVSFEMDALVMQAETDPIGALQVALAMESSVMQSLVLPRIAEMAANRDPRMALAQAAMIEDFELRSNYSRYVLDAWASSDPAAVFAYLENAELSQLPNSLALYQSMAESDPDRLLVMLETFPPAVRTIGQRAVAQALAERDPAAALSLLDSLPPGQDRENLMRVIAQAYGRQNPDLALAWAQTLVPPSQDVLASVMQGIAAVDFDRALDLVIAELEKPGPAGISGLASSLPFSLMMISGPGGGGDMGRVADRLLGIDNPRTSAVMASVISLWAQQDTDAAMNWALANADELEPQSMQQLSRQVARQDIELAMRTLEQLRPERREAWVDGIANELAQSDIARAISFLDSQRGQPGYDSALSGVIRQLARSDPAAAAKMLASGPATSTVLSASMTVARQWAQRDPAAAADWAIGLSDSRARTSSLSVIASSWAQGDAVAARQWLYRLNVGPDRDMALNSFISATAQAGEFDPQLLDAYSSDAARQQGAGSAIVQIGRSDPNEAKRLLNVYITDPDLRQRTEEQLARTGGAGVNNGVIISDGGFIFLP